VKEDERRRRHRPDARGRVNARAARSRCAAHGPIVRPHVGNTPHVERSSMPIEATPRLRHASIDHLGLSRLAHQPDESLHLRIEAVPLGRSTGRADDPSKEGMGQSHEGSDGRALDSGRNTNPHGWIMLERWMTWKSLTFRVQEGI